MKQRLHQRRLFFVLLLGFSSGLPLALLTSTLQAWFSTVHASLSITGFLSLIGLPYLLRFFWGPLLDRFYIVRWGRRRSWILGTQCILFLGFNLLAFYDPVYHPGWMAFIAVIIAFASATQDAAIDAHRIEYLPQCEHALGATLAIFGYRAALFLSGGLTLVLAPYWGFSTLYHLSGFCVLIVMWATFNSQEPSVLLQQHFEPLGRAYIAPWRELIQRDHIIVLVFFVLFYKFGEAFTATSSGIVMPFLIQGLGFDIVTIGYVNKFLGVGAILAGGFVAGIMLLRFSLFHALLIFGLLQALSNILFVLLAVTGKNFALFVIAATCDNFAAGLASTALVAFFMRMVDKQYTATQFSILVAIAAIPRIFSGPVGVFLHGVLGWIGVYVCALVLSFAFIPLLLKGRQAWDVLRT